MRKRIIVASIISAVIATSITGCGNNTEKKTTTEERRVINTTGASREENTSKVSPTTKNEPSDDNEDTDTTVYSSESTSEENTTIQTTDNTTQQETTKPVSIPAVTDFDSTAARVTVPSDAVIEGHPFTDSVFIGDSRMLGLTAYNVISTSTVLADTGILSGGILTKAFITDGDKKVTVPEFMSTHMYKRAYIMLGINELGCSIDDYGKNMGAIIDNFRASNPKLTIYVIPTFPLVEGRTNEVVNNENVNKFNTVLTQVCKEKGVQMINASAAIINENGTLEPSISGDGIHLNKVGLTRFLNYIILATDM